MAISFSACREDGLRKASGRLRPRWRHHGIGVSSPTTHSDPLRQLQRISKRAINLRGDGVLRQPSPAAIEGHASRPAGPMSHQSASSPSQIWRRGCQKRVQGVLASSSPEPEDGPFLNCGLASDLKQSWNTLEFRDGSGLESGTEAARPDWERWHRPPHGPASCGSKEARQGRIASPFRLR